MFFTFHHIIAFAYYRAIASTTLVCWSFIVDVPARYLYGRLEWSWWGVGALLYLALISVELSSWLRIAGIIYFIMLLISASRFVICECPDLSKEARKKPMEGKSSLTIGDPACSPHFLIQCCTVLEYSTRGGVKYGIGISRRYSG